LPERRRIECKANGQGSVRGISIEGADSLERRKRTLELEGKVVCKMASLMVASEEEEGRRVVHLERPEVEDALPNVERRVYNGQVWSKIDGDWVERRRTSMEK
jgi:hypothetical protein